MKGDSQIISILALMADPGRRARAASDAARELGGRSLKVVRRDGTILAESEKAPAVPEGDEWQQVLSSEKGTLSRIPLPVEGRKKKVRAHVLAADGDILLLLLEGTPSEERLRSLLPVLPLVGAVLDRRPAPAEEDPERLLHEIEERRKAEAALVRKSRQLAEAEQIARLGSWEWDLSSHGFSWSDQMFRIFGLDPTETTPSIERYLKCVHPDDRPLVEEVIDYALRGHGPFSFHHRVRLPSDVVRVLHARIEGSQSRESKPSRLFGTVQDVTEVKQAQDQVTAYASKLQQSSRELESFAFIASHDMQEPLRKIQLFSTRLMTKFSDVLSERGRFYIIRIQEAAARMQRLINDLLSFSNITARTQPFEMVDLTQIAREVIEDLKVNIDTCEGTVHVSRLPVLEADPMQMREMLYHLISNSLKFHRHRVPPSVKVYSRTGMRAKWIAPGTFHLYVEDNGIGFEEKYLDRIFEPFQRLHGKGEYEGSGVGLAICRKIISRHGGTITGQSQPDQGSTFIITLPIRQEEGTSPINQTNESEDLHDGGND